MSEREEVVGYKQPPRATRFQKGKIGNRRGRPRNRRPDIPYDHVLGQMVTIREDGRERRVTAAEAFLLQLTKKGLQGDSSAARASLEAIEAARARRGPEDGIDRIRVMLVNYTIGGALRSLGIAVKLNPLNEDKVCWKLQPWIVEAAIAHLGDRRLTADEQRVVIEATRTPDKVRWPGWWTELS